MNQTPPSEQLSLETLQAIRFAEGARVFIAEDCRHSAAASPDYYSKLCSKLTTVSNDEINKVALPLFRSKMSESAAHATLSFFSSVEGRAISLAIVGSQPPTLSKSQLSALSHFNDSSAGTALQQFLGDPEVLPLVAQALAGHAP